MLAQLTLSPTLPKTLNSTHLLVLLPKSKALSGAARCRSLDAH